MFHLSYKVTTNQSFYKKRFSALIIHIIIAEVTLCFINVLFWVHVKCALFVPRKKNRIEPLA